MVRYKKPVEPGRYVEDRRGTPGRRAMGIGAGGGGIAILIAIVVALLGGGSGMEDLGPILEQLQAPAAEQPAPAVTAVPDDGMGAYMAAVMADTDAMWSALFQQAGRAYRPTKAILFTGFTESGCGGADARMGPHYCPLDERVYLDLDFFDELASRFGATGDFAAAYVMAHEVAHHVQNVLGLSEQVRAAQQQDPGRANEYSIRLELQADCFAGVWASTIYTDATGSAEVQEGYVEIDPGEIDEALQAAAAVGDDRIQIAVQGRVDPEKFNHGTAEQRVRWFNNGYRSGDPGACDTFSQDASSL